MVCWGETGNVRVEQSLHAFGLWSTGGLVYHHPLPNLIDHQLNRETLAKICLADREGDFSTKSSGSIKMSAN